MRAISIVVISFGLTACAEQPRVNTQALQGAAIGAQRAYLSCMDTAAMIFAAGQISASEAGIAAQGRCSAELTRFDLETHNLMIGSVTGAEWKVSAAERADRLVADIKRKAQESVVAKVVEQRMLSTPTPSEKTSKRNPNTGI